MDKKKLDNKKPKMSPYWIYGVLLTSLLLFNFFYNNESAKEVSWATLKNKYIPEEGVKSVTVINAEKVEISLKKSYIDSLIKNDETYKKNTKSEPQAFFTIGSVETFERNLELAQDSISEDKKILPKFEKVKSIWGDILGILLPIGLILAVWFFVMRRTGKSGGGGGMGGIFSVGQSKAKLYNKDDQVSITFKDVAGQAEAKIEIMEIVDFLKSPAKYTDLGGKIPKGALLIGPPGTGKTLLAKAVAGEAEVPFFSMSGSDFVEMFVGVGASRVRDLFAKAKEKAPCIVFIDEIDAIGRARGEKASMSGNDERENTLNQLLSEMDGFGTNAGVIIIAATNRVDILDKALLRAGRFDRQIQVELPDMKERDEIFKVHLKNIKLEEGMDTSFLARQTPGFSGADVANVCNEAALVAARFDKKCVDKDDFSKAIDRIVQGLEKRSKMISEDERRVIAYHEAGHATVSWMLEYANPLLKVTIVPRGNSLGAAWYMPEEKHLINVTQMMQEMSATLGGRAAEELVFKEITTGALNDLEKVSHQAYAMIAYYGMSSKLPNVSYYSTKRDDTFSKPYSEATSEIIDTEAKLIIEKAYNVAKKLLEENREGLDALAELLLSQEVVVSADLEKIFGPAKGKSIESYTS